MYEEGTSSIRQVYGTSMTQYETNMSGGMTRCGQYKTGMTRYEKYWTGMTRYETGMTRYEQCWTGTTRYHQT